MTVGQTVLPVGVFGIVWIFAARHSSFFYLPLSARKYYFSKGR